MDKIEERCATVYADNKDEPDKDAEVFYNPKMRNNRDISEIALQVFRSKIEEECFKTCDPLAGSGIRAFRYAKHTDNLVINDINPKAVSSIEKGISENKIDAELHKKDANVLLSENRNKYNFIDIDPFGSFANFLDSTARAAKYQSMTAFTATDNAVPAGSYPTTCMRRYGSRPFKSSFMHEIGIRIYLKEIFQNFARYDKAFEPKLCFHERHYTRLIGRVTESKKRTNKSLDNIGYLTYCKKCGWRKYGQHKECSNCSNKDLEIIGPLWTGKFVDQRFTEEMIDIFPEWEESKELLMKLHNEAEIITPFYHIHQMASKIGVSVPKRKKVIEHLRDKGYPVARTHISPNGLKTSAPIQDINEAIKTS